MAFFKAPKSQKENVCSCSKCYIILNIVTLDNIFHILPLFQLKNPYLLHIILRLLYTSVGKLPVHDEILNKNACGNFASLFSIIKNAIIKDSIIKNSFSRHGATCVEVPHFANLRIDGIILCSSPVSGNSVCVLI